MAFNVGFAQITVTPVFPGMQKAAGRAVNRVFPGAGRAAGTAMGSGMSSTMGPRGPIGRAVTSAGNLAARGLGLAGATGAASFASRAASGIARGGAQMTSSISRIGTGLAGRMAAAGRLAGAGFGGGMMAGLGPIAAVFGVGASLWSGISRLMALEDSEAQLGALGYDLKEIDKINDEVMEAVTGTPVAFDKGIGVAGQLLASGVEHGGDLNDVMMDIIDTAVASNTPFEQMGDTWTKIFALGRVQGEHINQLAAAGVPALEILSKHLNMTTEEVQALITAGGVDAKTFSDAMGTYFAGSAVNAADTTRGAFANLRTAIARLFAGIAEALGFEDMRVLFIDIREHLDGFSDWITNNEGTVETLASVFKSVAFALGAVKAAWALVARFFKINWIALAITAIVSVLVHLWRTNDDFKEGIISAWDAIKNAIAVAWEDYIQPALVAIGDFLVNTLIPAFLDFWHGTIKPTWNSISTAIKAAWEEVIRPALTSLWDFVTKTLVPALVSFWQDTVKPAFEGVRSEVVTAWEGYIKPALTEIVRFVRDDLAPRILWLWQNIVQPAFETIGKIISWAWNNVIKPIFGLLVRVLRDTVGPTVSWLYHKVVKPTFKFIAGAIEVAWNVMKFIFDAISHYIKVYLAPSFRWFRDKVIRPVWDWISTKISNVWNNNIKPILTKLGNFISDTVAPGFDRGVSWIGRIWDGLKAIAAAPINFVIDTVYNKGIRAAFNKVAGAIGSSARLPHASRVNQGGGTSSYSTPGAGRGGRGSATMRAKGGFTAPGYTIVGEEGPELLDLKTPGRVYTAQNTAALMSKIAEKRQSEFSPSNPPHGGAWDTIKSGARRAASATKDWVLGGLGDAAALILNPVKRAIQSQLMGKNALGDIAGKISTNGIDDLVKWIKGKDEDEGGPWQGMSDVKGRSLRGAKPHVKAAAFTISDAIQPGMFMQAFNRSMQGSHGQGLAVDFMAKGGNLQKTANFMVANHKKLNGLWEVIYNRRMWTKGRGWRPLRGGMGNDPGHVWHVHGGWGAQKYDQGGYLMPGTGAVSNFTRKPEPVLTSQQWADVSTLAQRGATTHGDTYDVSVSIDPRNLDGLKSVEEFVSMIRRKKRQR